MKDGVAVARELETPEQIVHLTARVEDVVQR
jgi:hypothetical protein